MNNRQPSSSISTKVVASSRLSETTDDPMHDLPPRLEYATPAVDDRRFSLGSMLAGMVFCLLFSVFLFIAFCIPLSMVLSPYTGSILSAIVVVFSLMVWAALDVERNAEERGFLLGALLAVSVPLMLCVLVWYLPI